MSLLLSRFLGISLVPSTNNSYTGPSFSHNLFSIGGELRLQMHNTWLILGAFGALTIASLLWVIAEKWQIRSNWSRKDVTWMACFGASLGFIATLYRVGTHGAIARRFAISEAIADLLAVGVALAVPVLLWFRWHKSMPGTRHQDDHEALSSFHYSRTILGLQDYSSAPLARTNQVIDPKQSTTAEVPPVIQSSVSLQETVEKLTEPQDQLTRSKVTKKENMNILSISGQSHETQAANIQPESVQPVPPQQVLGEPIMSHSFPTQSVAAPAPPLQPVPPKSVTSQPVATQFSAPERANVPAATFREQLTALNATWQQIEETGKEIEDWFERQQKRVLAHLERPATKINEDHVELSHDFLEQKMNKVDAEWAAIHQTVREMYRWLENGNLEKEATQETKVW